MGELLLINKWLIQKKNHLTQKQYKINSNLHLISWSKYVYLITLMPHYD